MSCADHPFQLEAATAGVEAARDGLLNALDAPWDDETATERIIVAMNRLRRAQAREMVVRTGIDLADLVGRG